MGLKFKDCIQKDYIQCFLAILFGYLRLVSEDKSSILSAFQRFSNGVSNATATQWNAVIISSPQGNQDPVR